MLAFLRPVVLVTALLLSYQATAQDVQRPAKHAVELGWSYFEDGDLETALKRFNQALLLDPNFAPAYFGIAYVYSVQNKLELAIKNYRTSIEKDPTFSHSYSNLGLALFYSGNLKEALPNLEKALDLDPRNGDAHVNIALYYLGVGDYLKSWKHIHLAQRYNANVSPNLLRDLENKMAEPPRGDP